MSVKVLGRDCGWVFVVVLLGLVRARCCIVEVLLVGSCEVSKCCDLAGLDVLWSVVGARWCGYGMVVGFCHGATVLAGHVVLVVHLV